METLETFSIRIPATTANLGPGFDCLGMALDLWNHVTFSLEGDGIDVQIDGEGKEILNHDASNLVARTVLKLFAMQNEIPPRGLRINCYNNIPVGSGLGSSASAVLAGLLGANIMLNSPLSNEQILRLGYEIEGHPDNISAALFGGLVVIVVTENEMLTRRFDIPPLLAVVVVPTIDLPTHAARTALPKNITYSDAVYNMGRTTLVVDALRNHDLILLGKVMDDRLHQSYRLKLIPGSETALRAARLAGASAVALSGAGPGLIAFSDGSDPTAIANAMRSALENCGVSSRSFLLPVSSSGAVISCCNSSKNVIIPKVGNLGII